MKRKNLFKTTAIEANTIAILKQYWTQLHWIKSGRVYKQQNELVEKYYSTEEKIGQCNDVTYLC